MTTTNNSKTQINNLQRGHGRSGIIGSSNEVRREVAMKVKMENPEMLTVMYRNRPFSLHYGQSLSGKSFWYISDALPLEVVSEVVPFDKKALEHPELVEVKMIINGDMTAEFVTFRRARVTRQWKSGQTIEIAERDITII